MATIITREVGGTAKNSPLTNAELDNNFINLNDAIEDLQTPATTTSAGLMSASDKTKLDGVETGAQVNTVASVAGKTGAVSLVQADIAGLPDALAAKQDTLVSGSNLKTVGGQSLLGTGNVSLGGFLYGAPEPNNGDGSDGDVYIQADGKLWKKRSGVWTYTGIQFAADSVALTDEAGTATLPATAAAPVASHLQVLRNNVKQAFADLAGKMGTAGGVFTNGISFGSAMAASPSTVTRHIALHGTGYGFSITGSRLNYVVAPTATHRFMVGSAEIGSISSAGDLLMASNVTAYSDPRLKENFERVQDPFYILSQLDGGTFNWRHGIPHIAPKAGKRDYGVLADQVKAVMPEIVIPSVEIDGEVYDTVCYEKLVPVLIEAVKALHARVIELESKGD